MTEKFIQLLNEMLAQNGPMLKGVSAKTVAEYKNMVEQNEVDPDRFYLVYDENADESTGTIVLVNGKSVYIFDADTKQDKEDEGLETVAKNIVDAINEVRRSIPSLAGLASETYAEQKAAEKAGEALQSAKAYMDKAIVEEVAKIVAGADASFDTLKEIADWIKAHPESVAEINALIQANAEKIILNETAVANVRVLLEELQSSSVKVSDRDAFVTNALTNLTLTSDEKTSVCNAIGALPKPSGIPTGVGVLTITYNMLTGAYTYGYASMGNSATQIVQYSSTTSTDMSMMYGSNVTIYVDIPKGNKQAANKMFVENLPDYFIPTDTQKTKWLSMLGIIEYVSGELSKIVAGADSSFDTLKEIADWIKAHPEDVAAINAAIQANTDKINGLITYSTTDIGEGSALADGAIYVVYEE